MRILIVEDEAIIYLYLKALLEQMGHTVVGHATNFDACIDQIVKLQPDLVSLDINLEGPDDGVLLGSVIEEEFDLPMIYITGYSDQKLRDRVKNIKKAIYLMKPINPRQLQESIDLLANQTIVDQSIKSKKTNVEQNPINKLYYHTDETAFHTARVKFWAKRLGQQLGLPDDQLLILGQAAFLHDVGKVMIAKDLLNKANSLTKDEYEVVKKHTSYAKDVLDQYEGYEHAYTGIRAHHERWDGAGYPDQLLGEDIPLHGRIIALADAFDVMTHKRSYKTGISTMDALKELKRMAGSQFDPNLVDVFVQCVQDYMYIFDN